VFQVLYACYINSWLINGVIYLGTIELKEVVGYVCLNESISIFTWPRDQSLGCVVVHLFDYSDLWLHLEETIDYLKI
jgi:hypothetical protein